MSEDEGFGQGIKLDQDFDLEVDATGDLGYEAGLDELQKDLAFSTGRFLDVREGAPLSKSEQELTRVKAARIVQQDPRIQEINNIEVRLADSDELKIELEITADDDTVYDFVFPV